MTSFDGIVAAIVLLAVIRGLYIGLTREAFSIAALAGACIAVNYATGPAASLITEFSNGKIGTGPAPWIAGFVIAVASVFAIGMLGRVLRRGVRAVGLGWADRLGGIALGAAEGFLVAALLVLGTSWVLGTQHPSISNSRSVSIYEDLQGYIRNPALPSNANGSKKP